MIDIQHLTKTFRLSGGNVDALRDVSLHVNKGEIFGVIGYSGAGKSTLVRCINLLETPEIGSVSVGEYGQIDIRGGQLYRNGKRIGERELGSLRRGVGMIFQHFNLLERSTVFENVAYPLKYSGHSKAQIAEKVRELLALVDLTDKTDAYPSQLSGGQKQRVAIARALANDPQVLLSDEATSALDPEATEAILDLLRELNRKLGLTIVLITHEMAVIKAICRRVAVMENGCVVEEGNVYDIFSAPKQSITRRFVASSSSLGKIEKMRQERSPLVALKAGEKLVRLTFGKDSVGDSIISRLSREFDVNLNIVLANVDVLEGNPLGGMAAIISGEQTDGALQFLRDHQIIVEVLDDGTAHS